VIPACFIVLLDAPTVPYVTIVWKGSITIALGLDSALARFELNFMALIPSQEFAYVSINERTGVYDEFFFMSQNYPKH
jgi:hypothetical protein